MSNYMTNISAKELLNSWLAAGLVTPAASQEIEVFTANRFSEKELPLYLRILVGVGAFISSLCLIAFLSVSNIVSFRSEAGLIFWGLIFVGSAVFVARLSLNRESAVSRSFVMQFSCCLIGVGKILFVMGVALLFEPHEGWGVTLGALFISAATYHIYRMSIDRFLSALAVFTSLLINIVTNRILGASAEVILMVFFFAQLVFAAFLFTNAKVKRDYVPLAYAVAVSLCISVLYFSMQSKIDYRGHVVPYSLVPINIALSLALIGLIGWAAGNSKRFLTEPFILACLGVVLLGSISAPGIILSIGLLILGYSKHEKLLLLIAVLLMPCFIVLYYYNLDVSLLAKSGILVASGIILLIGRLYLNVRKLDRLEHI